MLHGRAPFSDEVLRERARYVCLSSDFKKKAEGNQVPVDDSCSTAEIRRGLFIN